MPEMGFVTVFSPLTKTGASGLVVQTGEARFVVDCRVKPVKLVGQVRITFWPSGVMDNCGGKTRLKTVP